MSGLSFRPGKKGELRKVLNKLFFCQTSVTQIPFTGTGFTYIYENGQFVITFNTNGTIKFNTFSGIDYVAVSGGGGGGGGALAGGGAGGGGGGGQVLNGTFYTHLKETVTVTVGNGGEGGLSDTGYGSTSGTNGENTNFNTGSFIINANGGQGGINGISFIFEGGKGGNNGSNSLGGIGGTAAHKNGYNGINGSGGGGGYYESGSGGNGAQFNSPLLNYGAGGGGGNGDGGAKGGTGGNNYAGNGGQCYPINPGFDGSSAVSNYGGGGGGGTGGNGIIGTSGAGGNGGSGIVIFYVTSINDTCLPCEGIGCIQEKVNKIKTGYTDPVQTQSARISQLVTNSLGGRTTFGNVGLGLGVSVNARTYNTYLGGIEGQPGGSPRPLRNKF